MTPDELRVALAQLGLSQSEAARRWRVDLRTLQRWCSGDRPIPGTVVTIVELEIAATPRPPPAA